LLNLAGTLKRRGRELNFEGLGFIKYPENPLLLSVFVCIFSIYNFGSIKLF